MGEKRLLIAFFLVTIFVGIAVARQAPQTDADKCVLLVAKRDLPNALFEKSVIVMLPRGDEQLVVGLIVNKPTRLTLQDVFPNSSALKKSTETVFFGGPVDTGTPSVLFRSPKPVKEAFKVAGDLYVSFDKDLIQGMLKKPKQVADVRLFMGRSQWGPVQLQEEMASGAWFTDHEEGSWMFDPHPEMLWPTLIARLDPGTVVDLTSGNLPFSLQ